MTTLAQLFRRPRIVSPKEDITRLEQARSRARSSIVFHAVHEARRRAHSLEPPSRPLGANRGSVSGEADRRRDTDVDTICM